MTTRASISSSVALKAFVAAIAIGMCLGLLVILGLVNDERPLVTSFVIAATCLVTFVTALVADNGRFPRWMRVGARVGWVAGAGWILVVWAGDSLGWLLVEPMFRALGALSFLAAWTAASGLTLLARSGGWPAAAVRIRCPRCAADADIAANTSAACPGCRLLLRVQFDEPRCGCGFLIYRLEAANCPECGREVPASLRWGGAVTPSPASVPPPSP